MRLELFPFRFRDPVSGKWVRARYRSSVADLAQRYGEGRYEIIGPPEIRDVDPDGRYFNPARGEPRMDRDAVGNVSAVVAVARSARRVVVVGIAV